MTGVDCATKLPHRGGQGCQGIYDDFTHARTLAIAGYVATGLLTAGSIIFVAVSGGQSDTASGLTLRCGPILGPGAACRAAF